MSEPRPVQPWGHAPNRPWRQAARHAGAWLGVLMVLTVGYGFRYELGDVGNRVLAIFVPSYGYSSTPDAISFSVGSDGHFWVSARVDGVGFRFMVDTGASAVVFSKADARRLGVDPASLRYDRTVLTANGATTAAAIRLRKLAIGPIVVSDVPALVTAGDLSDPLLGMRFLERLSAVEITNGRLTLRR